MKHAPITDLLTVLAAMPDHSPEWLENPSVRVQLRAAVVEARVILWTPPTPLVARDIRTGETVPIPPEALAPYRTAPPFSFDFPAVTEPRP